MHWSYTVIQYIAITLINNIFLLLLINFYMLTFNKYFSQLNLIPIIPSTIIRGCLFYLTCYYKYQSHTCLMNEWGYLLWSYIPTQYIAVILINNIYLHLLSYIFYKFLPQIFYTTQTLYQISPLPLLAEHHMPHEWIGTFIRPFLLPRTKALHVS